MSLPASFPGTYRENLIQTIQTIDAAKVNQAIEWFREARDHGKAIFVAGKEAAQPPRRTSCAT